MRNQFLQHGRLGRGFSQNRWHFKRGLEQLKGHKGPRRHGDGQVEERRLRRGLGIKGVLQEFGDVALYSAIAVGRDGVQDAGGTPLLEEATNTPCDSGRAEGVLIKLHYVSTGSKLHVQHLY